MNSMSHQENKIQLVSFSQLVDIPTQSVKLFGNDSTFIYPLISNILFTYLIKIKYLKFSRLLLHLHRSSSMAVAELSPIPSAQAATRI